MEAEHLPSSSSIEQEQGIVPEETPKQLSEAKEAEESNPESALNIEEKMKELFMMPKISEEDLKLQAEEDAQKYEYLDSNLDDLFAKINRLAEEVMVEPKFEHKESLQVEPVSVQLQLKKHAVSEPCKAPDNVIEQSPVLVLPQVLPIGLGVTEARTKPRDDTLNMSLFQLGKTVGSGKFGEVCQCRHLSTGTLYAIKKIFKSTVAQYKIQQHLIEQLTILHTLDHPNIIKQYACFTDEYHVFMVLEYVDGFGLIKHLKSDQKTVSRIVFQVATALKYLHGKGIMHRDLKPENILYEYGVVKLCDFGWATSFKQEKSTTFCGTLDYLSPEVAAKLPYDCSVDVWSVGVLTYQLLCGKVPFKDADKQLQMKKILECDTNSIVYSEQIGADARELIQGLLKKSPEERMTLDDVLAHPFLTKYNDPSDSDIEQEASGELHLNEIRQLLE